MQLFIAVNLSINYEISVCIYMDVHIYIYTSNYRIPREKISLILGKALWHLTEKRTQNILNLEWLLKMKKTPNHQHLIPTWFYWTGFTSLPVSCWVQLTEVQQRLTGQMCCSGWAWHEDRSKWPLTAHTRRSVEVPLALPTGRSFRQPPLTLEEIQLLPWDKEAKRACEKPGVFSLRAIIL